jgi:hypothetical protein
MNTKKLFIIFFNFFTLNYGAEMIVHYKNPAIEEVVQYSQSDIISPNENKFIRVTNGIKSVFINPEEVANSVENIGNNLLRGFSDVEKFIDNHSYGNQIANPHQLENGLNQLKKAYNQIANISKGFQNTGKELIEIVKDSGENGVGFQIGESQGVIPSEVINFGKSMIGVQNNEQLRYNKTEQKGLIPDFLITQTQTKFSKFIKPKFLPIENKENFTAKNSQNLKKTYRSNSPKEDIENIQYIQNSKDENNIDENLKPQLQESGKAQQSLKISSTIIDSDNRDFSLNKNKSKNDSSITTIDLNFSKSIENPDKTSSEVLKNETHYNSPPNSCNYFVRLIYCLIIILVITCFFVIKNLKDNNKKNNIDNPRKNNFLKGDDDNLPIDDEINDDEDINLNEILN